MSRFRLYGSGGRPVYDSEGEPADQRLDRIKREFNAGVAMFYDPAAGLVRAQVKIHRRSPEQFVATYQTDGDEDLIAALVEHVQRVVDSRDWTIQHGIGGTQALYDAFSEGTAFESDAVSAVERDLAADSIGPDEIRDAVAEMGAVDLRVPDYETAAATLAYVRDTFDGYAVAVTESTDVETIAGADVFVRPARDVDRVAPGPEFAGWIDRWRAAAAADAFERAVDSLAARFESDSTDVPTGLAVALDRVTAVSDLGVRAVPTSAVSDSAVERRELRRTLRYGLPSGIALGLALGLAWPGVVSDALGSLPRWLLALGGLLLGTVWFGVLFSVRVARGGDARRERAVSLDAAADDIEAVGDALARLRAIASDDDVREHLADTLEPYGVAVEPADDRTARRRRSIAAGLAASAGVGALAFAIVVVGASVVG